ncbi:MAG TPA: GNAT family N-acetyltransferase [Caulobacteraceae bacterium]
MNDTTMDMLRALLTEDAPAAVDVIRRAFSAQSVETDPPSAALRETTESIADAIGLDGGACVTFPGGLKGVVLWSQTEQGLYFGRLAVHPDWRGSGVARRLIAAVEAEAMRRNLPRVHLNARLVLADNRRLFASCGYQETEFGTHDGFTAPTFVVMEKILDGAC